MTVLDLSNYDADTLDVACLKAAGVTGVILGCQRDGIARTMADTLVAGGMPILGVYAFLYFKADTVGQTATAIAIARDYGIKRVWLDVEDTTEGSTPAERAAEVANCVALVVNAGLEPGIYTGAWYWPNQMGNTTEFSHLPLWHSEYPHDRHEVRQVNYGGWTDVAVHQYASDIHVCGRVRDHNYVFEETEADMTPDEVAAIAAGQWLELFKQTIGVTDSTFSDTASVDAIRAKLAGATVEATGAIAPGTKFTVEVIP